MVKSHHKPCFSMFFHHISITIPWSHVISMIFQHRHLHPHRPPRRSPWATASKRPRAARWSPRCLWRASRRCWRQRRPSYLTQDDQWSEGTIHPPKVFLVAVIPMVLQLCTRFIQTCLHQRVLIWIKNNPVVGRWISLTWICVLLQMPKAHKINQL